MNEGITRRKFFWFMGASFALAATGGLVLAERAPVSLADEYEDRAMTPGDLASIDRILKDIYLPAIRKQLDESPYLLRHLVAG